MVNNDASTSKNKKDSLKIVLIGFDWRNISFNDISLTKKKLDRDGLRTNINCFLMFYAGLKFSRQKISSNPLFLIWHFYLLSRLRILYDLFFIFAMPFVLFYEKFKPDVFYLGDFPHIFSVIIPAKICKSKIFFRIVTLPTELALAKGFKGNFFFLYYWIIERLTFRFVDRFIAINDTTKNYLINLGVKEDKIVFDIPNTILRDKEYIEKADIEFMRKKHNISSDKKIIISVGSLIKEKGYFELLSVFAKLNREDLILIICGEGAEKENLEKFCRELKIEKKVIFAGSVGREEIWNYFFGSDIFMLFSKSESLGMVFWEAMYAGLPVIGTPVGGVKETIGDDSERGFYFKIDLSDLEGKIDFCLNNSQKQAMVDRAKKYIASKLKLQKTINEIYNKKKL